MKTTNTHTHKQVYFYIDSYKSALLPCSDSEKDVLGKDCEVFLRKEVEVVFPGKKGEVRESRVLVSQQISVNHC